MTSCAAAIAPEAELSQHVSTVVTVRWELAAAEDDAYVAFGTDEALGRRAPAERNPEGQLEAFLVGLKPDTDVYYQAVTDLGDRTLHSEVETIATGSLPSGLPELLEDAEPASGGGPGEGFLLTSFTPGPAVVLDADGDVVWWYEPDVDFAHVISRVLRSRAGDGFLVFAWTKRENGGLESDERFVYRVALDGQVLETIPLPSAHHDLTELPGGTLAVLTYDPRTIEGEEIAGDRLQEIAPGGEQETVWSIWDHVDYDPAQEFEGGERWGHCNALQYDDGDDSYYLSSRNFSTIFKIDRATGEVLWHAGRTDSDFELAGGAEGWFENQHQFRVLGDRLLVFDNGVQGGVESEVVEIALDLQRGTATEVWSYSPDPPLGVYAFGDVHRFDGGETMVNWGASGRLELLDAEGRLQRLLDLPLGNGLGYMSWVDSLY